jgi:dihydrofolate reductase
MGRIVITEHLTLDGVVEDFGGDGWQFQFDRGKDGEAFKLQELHDTAALLLGRVTYDIFAASWPSEKGALADALNPLPKYVVSSTLDDPGWNTQVLRGNPVEQISKLKGEVQGDLVVHGSGRLARTLLDNDLVDELRLMIFPLVLGHGERLFGSSDESKRLQLVESRPVGLDGILIVIYRPAGRR